MRLICVILLLLLLISSYNAAGTTSQAVNELLIKNVQVISPDNTLADNPTDVLVRAGQIFSIGKQAIDQASNSAIIIDGAGQYLVPGLIDGHTHLNEVPGMTFEHEQNYPMVSSQARYQIPRSYLYHGFTTVVDLNYEPSVINTWNSKAIRPHAYFCGAAPVFDGYPMSFIPKPARYQIMPYFLFDETRADEFPKAFDLGDHSPAAVVNRIHNDGGICVKTHYEKGFGGRGNLPVPTTDLVKSLVNEAHKQKLPVLMHANSESAQTFGLDTGIDAFAHGMWTWNDRTATNLHSDITTIVDATIAKKIALQPTIQVLYGEQDIHNPDYFTDIRLRHVLPASLIDWYATEDGQWWRTRMLNVPIVAQLVESGRWEELDAPPIARVSTVLSYFAKNGGKLLFGSDTPSDPTFANPPGLNGRIEMDRWIAAGVTPAQLFNAATINNADFFGLADEIGTVEVGKTANLLILSENPLQGVSAYDSIEYIILAGKVIERSSLSALKTVQ